MSGETCRNAGLDFYQGGLVGICQAWQKVIAGSLAVLWGLKNSLEERPFMSRIHRRFTVETFIKKYRLPSYRVLVFLSEVIS